MGQLAGRAWPPACLPVKEGGEGALEGDDIHGRGTGKVAGDVRKFEPRTVHNTNW